MYCDAVLEIFVNLCVVTSCSATTASQYSSQRPTPTGLDTLPIRGTITQRTSYVDSYGHRTEESTSASGGMTAAAQVVVQTMERQSSSARRSEDI
ncbi:hypothetical protein EV421DRAFT_543421 [Armillaria borealis]|uniref:Secreted protein n=1 Tax=Armillaria borealis TaxID=47425 RepID=A0AA39JIW9_9AGAR|nr:hypothetical protein EV421DRAFT_543421 [Armillaria borealis]